MSFLGPPFKHDVFISYSHGRSLGGDQEGYLRPWSQTFAKELEKELRGPTLSRRAIRVFMDGNQCPDRGLDPMAPLSEELQTELGLSAIFLVLMSDFYLDSKWCRQEREWWAKQFYEENLITARKVETGLPARKRISIVRILPTTIEWPEMLKDTAGEQIVGFKFHREIAGESRPLGYGERDFQSAIFDSLMAIVARINNRLESIKETLGAREAMQANLATLAQPNGQVIYLHGRATQAKRWEETGRKLSDNGYVVFPGEPDAVESDPVKAQEIREQRVQTMAGCDALMLLGTEDGRALDADMVVVGRQDRNSARSRSNRLLPCSVLDTAGGVVATSMRKASARNLQVDWLDATSETWPERVRDWFASGGNRVEAA